jgi:anti-sigma B factor antagonist
MGCNERAELRAPGKRENVSINLSEEQMAGGVTRVILDGKLDLDGARAIDLRMNVIAGSQKSVIIDLQKVSFVGSMGLRSLVAPARTIKSKGGKVVFFGPNEMVDKVLKISGLDKVVPICYELDQALAAVQ